MTTEQKSTNYHSVLVKLVSATCGALITSFVTTPLEVVKTRLQTSDGGATSVAKAVVEYCKECAEKSTNLVNRFLSSSSSSTSSSSHNSSANCAVCVDAATGKVPSSISNNAAANSVTRRVVVPASALSTLVSVAKIEGVPALWSGLSISLAMSLPTTALYFTCYDELKDIIEKSSPNLAPYSPLLAGSSARAVAVTALSPMELLRTKAMHRRSDLSILQSLRAEISEGGVRSLYRGLGPTLLRDVPFSGLYWYNYERLRAYALKRLPDPTASELWMASFFSGLGSGTLAALVTTPFDVVKTRKQVKYKMIVTSSSNIGDAALHHVSTLSMLRTIFKEEGFSGIFRGWNMRVARVGPASAIMISSYELGKRILSSNLSST